LSVTVTASAEAALLVLERLAGFVWAGGAGVAGAGAGVGAGGFACAERTVPRPKAIALVIRSRFIPCM
jgi:hypothetical protein